VVRPAWRRLGQRWLKEHWTPTRYDPKPYALKRFGMP
jgi:hypothetical protein